MKLTRAAEYGIRAALHLASCPPGRVCLISEISASQDVPEKYLAKILQTLTKGGIVRSHRGAKGGFTLSRPPESVSLREIIECIEGPMALNNCLTGPESCGRSGSCPVHPVWKKAQRMLLEVLEGADLKSLTGGVSVQSK